MAQASEPTTRVCTLVVVIPCYNEEQVLPETARRMLALIESLVAERRISASSRILFVDDGSRDNTWAMIEALGRSNRHFGGIKLSRNRGHQNAVLAGLFSAKGDAIVSIDADLQDDVSAIEKMLEHYEQGADIVYGVRDDRTTDSFLKRATAQSFYRLMRWLGTDSVYNHADFRLMSSRAIDALKEYSEVNLFLRGMVPLLGFNSSTVTYARGERFAGVSKYPFRKMLGLALDAVTSFSVAPLRLITLIGFLVFLMSIGMTVWIFWVSLFTSRGVPGWASTILPIYFLGGVQILCIGILGEYLGKVYQETKARPRFIIDKTI